MYAVFQTGGKQYRAKQGDVLKIEKLELDAGSDVATCSENKRGYK